MQVTLYLSASPIPTHFDQDPVSCKSRPASQIILNRNYWKKRWDVTRGMVKRKEFQWRGQSVSRSFPSSPWSMLSSNSDDTSLNPGKRYLISGSELKLAQSLKFSAPEFRSGTHLGDTEEPSHISNPPSLAWF